ncbi:ribonuclease P protein component [Streptococcus merionis]|uniref:ribonuclease P protein component n=1 Tax=Streptococcus merionis TaxID=400065 RepID=UPI0026F26DBE|nr:ribonuclease P protein component [Streptococcus merionis]
MRKSYRIKREKDFSAIFKQGQNVANRKFVLYRLDKEQAHFRVGLSVSKKLGNAVVRNRVKRLMRHVLINHRQQIKAEDFVLIARKGVEELNYHEVEKNLLHILRLANLYQEGRDCETND